MESFIGPVLPSHLKEVEEEQDESEIGKNVDKSIGPALPPGFQASGLSSLSSISSEDDLTSESEEKDQVSLSLPSEHKRVHSKTSESEKSKSSDEDHESDDAYGPALPPGFRVKPAVEEALPRVIGPVGLQNIPKQATDLSSLLSSKISTSAQDSDSETDDHVIGPLPPVVGADHESYVTDQFNKRAEKMKMRLIGQDDSGEKPVERETWMLELPENKASQLGLGQRSFKKRSGPENKDRSVWTDTPADKARKAKEMRLKGSVPEDPVAVLQAQTIQARDEKMEQVAEKHSHKRKESLLELHQKELKKKKNLDKDKPKERRPFDRDVDLQVNRFDDAQKQAVLKKARLLNDRFSAGQQKFL